MVEMHFPGLPLQRGLRGRRGWAENEQREKVFSVWAEIIFSLLSGTCTYQKMAANLLGRSWASVSSALMGSIFHIGCEL